MRYCKNKIFEDFFDDIDSDDKNSLLTWTLTSQNTIINAIVDIVRKIIKSIKIN